MRTTERERKDLKQQLTASVASLGSGYQPEAMVLADALCADLEETLAENARLQERVEEAEAQVSGMQEEGCAARGLVENIFNGLTTRGTPVDPVLAQMADATAKLLVEVTVCEHKALAERRKKALEKCREGAQRIIVSMDAPIGARITAQGIKETAALAQGKKE